MTPDEFREKHGQIKDKVTVNCNSCGQEHDGSVTEESAAGQDKKES
jgi:hypothetical protein